MNPIVKGLISTAGLLLITFGLYQVFLHRQDIIDWWRLLSYKPSSEVSALADAAALVGRGKDLFYVSDPKVEDREQFNQSCTDTGEQSLVLGCYRALQIFIYNVADQRLNGVKEVTAAHEMLHAAYERLDSVEKDRINKLLELQLAKINDPRLSELIDLYNKSEPGELLNEMHSILGTEYANLSPELETYYKAYFSDRSKVVALAANYESIFTDSKTRIASYDSQLETLLGQINANNAKLAQQKATLEAQSAQLTSLKTSDPGAYNKAVPGYNSSVRAFNNLVGQTRDLVNRYNALVNTRNSEVAVQNDLYHSLDSNFQSVPTN